MTYYSGMYNKSIVHLGKGDFNWTTTTGSPFYCALTYTNPPDQTDEDFSAEDANQIAASNGYVDHGEAMVGDIVTVANSGTDPTVYAVFDSADTTWTDTTFTDGPARYAIVYEMNGGAHTADYLFSAHDFQADKTGGGGTFTVHWHDNGVARIQITDAA